MDAGSCHQCRAPIVWCVTAKGRKQPLNAKPEKRVVVSYDPTTGQHRGTVVDTYVAHFATCPNAASFRTRRIVAKP